MPEIREVTNLTVPVPEIYHLPNGIPVYDTNLGTQEVVRLELVFFAGRPFEKKKLASSGTAALLREGTKHHTGEAIAEVFDYYGGSLSMPVSMDMSNILVYSLTKHFEKLLPLLAEILSEPTFPQKDLDAFKERNRRRLKVDLTKNDVLAYRKFTELLYGEEHPYGYNSYPETYTALTREDLLTHFEENYTAANCMVFVSGNTGKPVRHLLEKYLGTVLLPGAHRKASLAPANPSPEKIRIPHPDGVQTAIRIGCPFSNRLHDDFNGLNVLNTILGGYFGSRLMDNIREAKGYTYNVYSSLDTMLYDGYFYIGTEVGNEFLEPTLREIYHECERLQGKLMWKNELEMVRNYLLGTMLTNLDGAFNVSEIVKSLVTEGLPLSAFEEMVVTIKTITAKELRELARKYLQRDKMWEVVV